MWSIIVIVILIIMALAFHWYRNYQLINSVTSFSRGTKSERNFVLKLLKMGVPKETIFHDLLLNTNSGKFAQIDVAVATTEGLLVFEVKDYNGWLYGNGNQTHWTKVLAYGRKKYRFYNPILQNQSHIEQLKGTLKQFSKIPFYSIIVFYGDCELKEINYVPRDTYLIKPERIRDVLKEIKQNNGPAPYTNKREVINILLEAVHTGEHQKNHKQHSENIKDMIGKHRIFD